MNENNQVRGYQKDLRNCLELNGHLIIENKELSKSLKEYVALNDAIIEQRDLLEKGEKNLRKQNDNLKKQVNIVGKNYQDFLNYIKEVQLTFPAIWDMYEEVKDSLTIVKKNNSKDIDISVLHRNIIDLEETIKNLEKNFLAIFSKGID